MARYVFKLPDVGEGVAEAEIVAWRVAVGEMVAGLLHPMRTTPAARGCD